ncbi:toprim domain-containing protein [Gluconacetobacter entanii]|uniref:DUF7146 domain-containing protein n=1 Tax=Gluconacetobacter entanii TaxID=108528 RepID=UPI001C935529|nr:toprim domain-containing protein [Gluconacetobacter entanii]MBY4639981.1 toprim domain-containing protein [Gluconacetobacter entanii]MCW4581824.1 toprim domain-containing protein [Gluconacetobacter entanii]MCW4585058.1 toprim domain-containing protein [Gluconacetobacter entanii]MCW4588780.1 toprim domain-containing protein [Gluconacetobacter entanii]
MHQHDAADLARRLAGQAEAVCRHYLPAGRRQGNYWLVGDARNTPGRSMFVRLQGSAEGKGAAGKWTDAASAEHGDLLDIIRETRGLTDFRDVADEARHFLSLPSAHLSSRPSPDGSSSFSRNGGATGSTEAARRLFAMSKPITGTIVETYLRKRGITELHETASLRFHPRCYYRADDGGSTETWPALIAAVTDLDGRLTGVHRTWLSPDGEGKAPVKTSRRAMGQLLGHAVRFGAASGVMAMGEGIETVLSIGMVLPQLPLAACLSSAHLAASAFPALLRRLYVIRDDDPAGDRTANALCQRAQAVGIEAIVLSPRLADFNDDLRHLGRGALRSVLRPQLAPQDVAPLMDNTV